MLAPLASGRAVPLPYRALRASVARWSRIRAKVSPKISPRTSSLSRNERWKPGRKPDAASSRSTCAASSSNSRQPRLTPSWEASRAPITGTTTQPVDGHLRRGPADLRGDRHDLRGDPVDPLGDAIGVVAQQGGLGRGRQVLAGE